MTVRTLHLPNLSLIAAVASCLIQAGAQVFAIVIVVGTVTEAPPRSLAMLSGDYRYDSGREGDWFLAGFSPRKDSLTLYLVPGLHAHASRLQSLGKYKTGKSCLYIKRLSDVDQAVLKLLIADAVRAAKAFAARS